MKITELLLNLEAAFAQYGDLEVIITAEGDDDTDITASVNSVLVEDDHSTEKLFVRIMGDQST